jgi:hypothetical protein
VSSRLATKSAEGNCNSGIPASCNASGLPFVVVASSQLGTWTAASNYRWATADFDHCVVAATARVGGRGLDRVRCPGLTQYLLFRGRQGCYRGSMMVFHHDYDLLTGMPASTVALSSAGTTSAIAAVGTMLERRSSRQPSCFRLSSDPSAPAVGVCRGREQGPEENSHKYLSFAVVAARNVA